MPDHDIRPFQAWLQEQMKSRDWSHSKLARELGVFKGTVGRWLVPPENEMHRRPNFESCRRLAELFGVDLVFVLEMVGMQGIPASENLTQLQRDTMSLIPMIPDDILSPVYEQLRPLIYEQIQHAIRSRALQA